MQNVVIIGARAFGIEISNLARHCIGYNENWQIKGFLDDGKSLKNLPFKLLNTVEDYQVEPNDVFVCALGGVKHKQKYIQIIKSKQGKFINLISKNSIIDSDLNHSEGIIIASFCTVSNNVSIGNYVTLQGFTTIGHDCTIGDYSNLGTYSFIGGYSKVENNVQMHTRATIIPSITVKTNAVIGAGSVVFRDVPADVTVVGNPAKILRF